MPCDRAQSSRGADELMPKALAAQVLIYEPAFDVADRGGDAAVGILASADLDEAAESAVRPLAARRQASSGSARVCSISWSRSSGSTSGHSRWRIRSHSDLSSEVAWRMLVQGLEVSYVFP